MLTKRIIPCLDIKDGQTVKGVAFERLRNAGDPVELAERYAAAGADELVLLDIMASHEGRGAMIELVARVAAVLNIPFAVGGGISGIEQVEALLNAGADKISVNSAAYRNPALIEQLAKTFGSQCVVVAIDANAGTDGRQYVWLNGGRIPTSTSVLDWVKTVESLGAGEILLTSMEQDGAKTGFALELTAQASGAVNIPVIASGGAGSMAHFEAVFKEGKADAALAASVFHFGEIEIPSLKKHLAGCGIPIRI